MATPDEPEVGPGRFGTTVVSSVYWQAGGQLLGQTVSWVVTLVTIRILVPGDYGLMAMAGVFVGILAMISEMGVGASAIQAKSLDRSDLGALAALNISLNVAAFIITLFAAPLVAAAFQEPRLTPVVRWLSLTFPLAALFVLPQAVLARHLEFRRKAMVEVVATFVAAVTALIVALRGGGVWALVASAIVLNAVKAVLFNLASPVWVTPRWARSVLDRHFRFGSVVMLDRVTYYLFGNIDLAIAGRVLGRTATGLYSVALTIAAIPLDKVLPSITQVSFAALSRIQHERERVNRGVLRGVRLASLSVFPLFVGLAIVADDAVPLILGPKWTEAVTPLTLLSLALPLKAVSVLLPPALFAIGRPGVNLGNMVLTLIIMTVGFLIGVQYGVVGLAASWLIAFPIAFLITTHRSIRVLGIHASDFVSALAVALFATAIMAAATAAVQAALPPDPALLRLVVTILVGAATYVACLLPFRVSLMPEIQLLLLRRRGQA